MKYLKQSIRLKLILSYAVIAILITVALTMFTRWNLTSDVRSLLRRQAFSTLEGNVADYVELNGSMDGFRDAFPKMLRDERQRSQQSLPPSLRQPEPAPNLQQRGENDDSPPQRPAAPGPEESILGVADVDGRVLIPMLPGFEMDQVFEPPFPEEFQPVEVDGVIVAYVLFSSDLGKRTPAEANYLLRTNIAFGIGSVIALLLAGLFGFFMSRNIADPLTRLTEVSKSMAAGDFDQKVEIETEDEIGQLAVAFNQMSDDLAESRRLRRQMTADIAHDLRSPLAVIAGYIESMRDEVLSPTPARFDTIYSEIEHLQHLISDLRTLSRADAGELPLNLQRLNPQELIDRTIASFQLQATKKKIEIVATAEEQVPNIYGDEKRLAQVLGNLVNNALRHTPEKGSIHLQSYRDANGVKLTVEDTGEGIPSDVLPLVFDRFYRVDEARQQNSGESGLGLAIAKSLVEAHGGTISVFSKVGFGTRFDIYLPAFA